MRGIVDQIRAAGAELVVVGNGSAKQAKAFLAELADAGEPIDFPLLTDPGRRTYKAAGLKRSIGATLNPALLGNAVRAFKKGHRQQGVKGDPWQQGGVFVVTPDDRVVFEQVSRAAGDHADPGAVLAAVAAL